MADKSEKLDSLSSSSQMISSQSQSQSHTTHHSSSTKVDLTLAQRGIWLVKVPKYLAARWEKIDSKTEAGKLRIYKGPPGSKTPKVKLSLSDATLNLKEPGEKDIPRDHDLIASSVANQTLAAFDCEAGMKDEAMTEPDKIRMIGKVQQKLECRPVANADYLMLKREEIKKASVPTRKVQQLDRAVNSYKPVANHRHNIEYEKNKKAEGKKARDDKDKVLEMLFAAFEKHQYYNLKDLVKLTNQPVGYLKEVLREVCNYCVKNPHKNMWELKPEYRHYKKQDDD